MLEAFIQQFRVNAVTPYPVFQGSGRKKCQVHLHRLRYSVTRAVVSPITGTISVQWKD